MEREQRRCNIHRSVYIFMSSANVLRCQVNAGGFFFGSGRLFTCMCVSLSVCSPVCVFEWVYNDSAAQHGNFAFPPGKVGMPLHETLQRATCEMPHRRQLLGQVHVLTARTGPRMQGSLKNVCLSTSCSTRRRRKEYKSGQMSASTKPRPIGAVLRIVPIKI